MGNKFIQEFIAIYTFKLRSNVSFFINNGKFVHYFTYLWIKDNLKRSLQKTNKTQISIKPSKPIIGLSVVIFRKVKAKAIGVNNIALEISA